MMSFAVVTIVKATLVCGAAFFVSRLCRRSRASIRHVLFALAFAALVVIPGASPVVPTVTVTVPAPATGQRTPDMASALGSATDAGPSGPAAPSIVRDTAAASVTLAQVVTAIWLAGVALFLMPVVAGLWQVRRLRHSALTWTEGRAVVQTLASSLGVQRRIDAVLHDNVTGPMTCGVFRPSILLPVSAREWDEASLRRALRHELEHIARWDFLTLCLSRMVCALYWFHPVVWAAWRRLRLEAERACDDAVVREDDARDYASLLVSMAQREPGDGRRPLLAMAGRNDLAARVAAVLDDDQARGRVGRRRAAALIVTAAIAMLGVAPITVAREVPQAPFADVSVKRHSPPRMEWRDGRLVATNVTVLELLRYAFSVLDVDAAPPWVHTGRFDITMNAPHDFVLEQGSKNLQSLLAERFKLVAHRGSREFPIYALVLARPGGSLGPQITRSLVDCRVQRTCSMSTTHGRMTGRGVTMPGLASHLLIGSRTNSQVIDRPIEDRTGLSGQFDVTLEWAPDAPRQTPPSRPFNSVLESSAPNLLAALEEQLGLKIESQLVPKPVLVIDSIEQPTEN
jgi:uncharacterized protein (TIGR03435 family)